MGEKGNHRSKVSIFVQLEANTGLVGERDLNVDNEIVGHFLGAKGEVDRSGFAVDLLGDGVGRGVDSNNIRHHMH